MRAPLTETNSTRISRAHGMRLSEAAAIADRPHGHDLDTIKRAHARLAVTARNGGVRNSERAQARLARRLDALNTMLAEHADTWSTS